MITPEGTIKGFAAIQKPSEKYNTYSCKMAFTGADAKTMKDLIDGYMKESMVKSGAKTTAKPPYNIIDKQLIVSFKNKAEVTSRTGKKFDIQVKVFDAKGQPIEELLGIGEGTVGRISFNPYMWSVPAIGGAGVTMQLEMFQVINLVKYSNNNSVSSNPFDAVEGGFVVEAPKASPFMEEVVSDDSGDF